MQRGFHFHGQPRRTKQRGEGVYMCQSIMPVLPHLYTKSGGAAVIDLTACDNLLPLLHRSFWDKGTGAFARVDPHAEHFGSATMTIHDRRTTAPHSLLPCNRWTAIGEPARHGLSSSGSPPAGFAPLAPKTLGQRQGTRFLFLLYFSFLDREER